MPKSQAGHAEATAPVIKETCPTPAGFAQAGLFSRLAFSYVSPLLAQASAQQLEDHDAEWLCPPEDDSKALEGRFSEEFAVVQVTRGGLANLVLFPTGVEGAQG